MMVRMQISLDRDMQIRLHERAHELGISLAEYFRRLAAADLSPGSTLRTDISALIGIVEAPASDIARDKDAMVGAAVEHAHLHTASDGGRVARRT